MSRTLVDKPQNFGHKVEEVIVLTPSAMVRGRPGRGPPSNPSSHRSAKPVRHIAAIAPETLSDLRVREALGGHQHDPRSLPQRPSARAPARPRLQPRALVA
jgi:hypothetical protein